MPVFMHTRIRVSDLDNSINFYCDTLGFEVQSRNARSPHGNQTCNLVMEGNEHILELTYSPDYALAVPEDLNRVPLIDVLFLIMGTHPYFWNLSRNKKKRYKNMRRDSYPPRL